MELGHNIHLGLWKSCSVGLSGKVYGEQDWKSSEVGLFRCSLCDFGRRRPFQLVGFYRAVRDYVNSYNYYKNEHSDCE